MASNKDFQGEQFRTESSWAGIARIFFITLILACGFLYYYFGPRVAEIQGNSAKASSETALVELTIGNQKFAIPENYTIFPRSRRGGEMDKVELYAALPNFEGFSIPRQLDFEGNDENSPIIYLSIFDPGKTEIELDTNVPMVQMSEREKFERVYLPHVKNPEGSQWRHGFMHYEFSETWAHPDEDLFVHESPEGEIFLFRCLKDVPTMPSPWCRRDMVMSDSLGINFRFKRPRLSDWRNINAGVIALVEKFEYAGDNMEPRVMDADEPTPVQAEELDAMDDATAE